MLSQWMFFDEIGPGTAPEHEQVSGERILLQDALDQHGKTIDAVDLHVRRKQGRHDKASPAVGVASGSVTCTVTKTGGVAANSCFHRRRMRSAMPYRRATSAALAPGCVDSSRIHCLSPLLNRRRCPSRGRGTMGPAEERTNRRT